MSYSTLLVHMQLGQPNGPMLVVAAELAERFGAGVIGVAACQPMLNLYSDGYIGQDVFEQDRDEKAREIATAEAAFRNAFRERSNVLEVALDHHSRAILRLDRRAGSMRRSDRHGRGSQRGRVESPDGCWRALDAGGTSRAGRTG